MRIICLVLFALAVTCITTVCRADYTYYYTGQDYEFYNGLYTSSESVTGWVTLTDFDVMQAIGPMVPVAFSFTDGIQTIDSSNAISDFFAFQLNDLNVLVDTVQLTGSTGSIGEYTGYDEVSYTQPSGVTSYATTGIDCYGDWSYPIHTSAVPEAPTLVLVCTGILGALGGLHRRFT
jgi:hypothetical protein